MENQMQVVAIPRKLWKVLRVLFFMAREGICKRKLLLLLKRGKLAGKALGILLSPFSNHHQDTAPNATSDLFNLFKVASGRGEYEFSCSNTPTHHNFMFYKRKQQSHFKTVEEEAINITSSPVLPGLGPRFMDSPISNSPDWAGDEGDCHVDEAAEEFIRKFFSQLRRQAITDA